jgi:hypothetical protein
MLIDLGFCGVMISIHRVCAIGYTDESGLAALHVGPFIVEYWRGE